MSGTDSRDGPRRERVAAVVLAAGMSTRMGRNKMLLEVGGESLIRRAAKNALEAGLDPVVVVVGFEAHHARRALEGLDVEIVINHDFRGPSSKSFHAGLISLPSDVTAAVVILPDMIHVSAETLGRVHAAASTSAAPLIASRYGDVTAPPILFRRALFDELLAWDGEGCGKPVVKAYAREAEYMDWPVAMLDDVDTPEDWKRVAG
jgi:molybdenum cofactor cytidylyltransferase